MSLVKQIGTGLLLAFFIIVAVNAGTGKIDLYSLLKLKGCEEGCPDEVIKEVSSYPQVVVDTTLTIITSDYEVVYTIEIYDDGEIGVTEIMNLRRKR